MKPKGMQLYKYAWGNNAKRKSMKGRLCKIIASGKKNSVCIEFFDIGQREIVSRRALRKVGAKDGDYYAAMGRI